MLEQQYDHFIAVDWAKLNMAVARMTPRSPSAQILEQSADIQGLKHYLKRLEGTKILTIEECNWSQWLYTELRPCVDELIVCDPFRNKLLNDGPKNDRIDAKKLCQLLRAGLLKPVFHTTNEFIYLRKIVSAYDDLVIAGARLKNQRNAIYRARGLDIKQPKTGVPSHECDTFVLEGLDVQIELIETQKKRYVEKFEALARKHKMIFNLQSIPGIGVKNACKLAAIVVDPKRFETKGAFLSYCGLVTHDKMSGGNFYGKRIPRCNKGLKAVFKTASMQAILNENTFSPYYRMLIEEKNYPEHQARHAVARRIAVLALGVMKSGKRFSFKGEQKTGRGIIQE